MKVTLLGTGGGEGIPAFLCSCKRCSLARKKRGKEIRQNCAAHVEGAGGRSILIDMPPQIMMSFARFKLDDTKLLAVLITHFHSDHSYGLKYLLEAITDNGYLEATHIELYLPHDVFDMVLALRFPDQPTTYQKNRDQFFTLHSLTACKEIEVGSFNVLPIKTDHLNIQHISGKSMVESLGYIIRDTDNKIFCYLTDTPPELPKESYEALIKEQQIDCLVFECSFDHVPLNSGHSDIKGIIDIRQKIKPKRIVATHISHRNLGHKELEKVLARNGIELGYDGMEIVV